MSSILLHSTECDRSIRQCPGIDKCQWVGTTSRGLYNVKFIIVQSITHSSFVQISAGSQVLLNNAERYGLLVANSINDTGEDGVLSRPNIGQCWLIYVVVYITP